MLQNDTREKNIYYRAMVLVVFVLSLLVNLYFCAQKQGFHEDEYYTYFSSNRSIGLYQPDREWQDRKTIYDEFAVKEGEGFNYGLVKLVQSWDVHPPLYYFLFHTMCSLKAGAFTKWTGLATNIIAFIVSFFILAGIMTKLGLSDYLKLTVLAFWGMNPQTVSCTLLIRMYAWLTVFVFACAYTHIVLIQKVEQGKAPFGATLSGEKMNVAEGAKTFFKSFLPVILVSFLGFLTQYFYIFFFVPLGFFFTVWLVFFRKEIKTAVLYVLSCAFSLGAAILFYPASVHHLLGGYRGNEAAESFLDIGNTSMRLSFFLGLLNDFVFSGMLFILLAVIVILIFVYLIRNNKANRNKPNKKSSDAALTLIAVSSICYFVLTSKAALLVGGASNRYEMPIYGLMIMIVFYLLDKYLKKFNQNISVVILPAVVIVLLAKGYLLSDNVLFLYKEDVEKINYAASNHNETAVVMFNPATPHNVWRLTDELLEYDEVFYINEENLDEINDEKILSSEKIILYAADDDFKDTAVQKLMEQTKLKEKSELFSEDMWTSYELDR